MTERLMRPSSQFILLKRRLKKPSFWFVLVLGLILIGILTQITVPDASNTEIGLLNGGGMYADRITSELTSEQSIYRYRLYTDRKEMENDVASGRLDCAFIFDSRLDKAAESGSLTSCADAVVSTSSTKSDAVKEEIFTVLLSFYSDQILSDQCDLGQIFKENTEDAEKALLDASHSLSDSDKVLQVFFEEIDTGKLTAASSLHKSGALSDAANSEQKKERTRASGRAAAVLVFAAALFFASGRFSPESRALRSALPLSTARIFAFTDVFLPLFVFTLLTDAVLAISGFLPAASLPRLLLALVVGVPLTSLWTAAFSSLFRHETICLFTIVAVLILASVLMVSDLTAAGFMTKSFRSLGCVLPDTWYAYLSGVL